MAVLGHEKLADQLIAASGALVRAARAAAAAPGPRDITFAQMELLRLVRRRPGLTAAEAATALRLARNTVSTLVGQLVRDGLLERTPDPDDGRVARLRLLPPADDRMAAWRARRANAVQAALSTLSAAEAAALAEAIGPLELLTAALTHAPEARP